MTRADFEQRYEQTQEKALAVATEVAHGARDIAEDALSDTVIEFLSNLEQRRAITPAMFIRRVVDRTRDTLRPQGRSHDRKRDGEARAPREVPLGTAMDLDAALYGPDAD